MRAESTDRVCRLVEADAAYRRSVAPTYDDVLREVIARVREAGSAGKLDIAALTAWKRLRADTRWVAELMSRPDVEVRQHTTEMVAAATDSSVSVSEAAGNARGALTPLPGFRIGDALASAVCFVAAPARLAVYDRRAHDAVRLLGYTLDHRPGRYRRFMEIAEDCQVALDDAGHRWTARRVDTALYQLGGPEREGYGAGPLLRPASTARR